MCCYYLLSPLISLIAELENYRRQAALNGDESKFDEADTLMAIVAAWFTHLEVKWNKHAIKKRSRNEVVNFQTLLTFLEDEAAASRALTLHIGIKIIFLGI